MTTTQTRFVPYNPDAIRRIRAGASARELGWDQSFYLSVCRRHGIEAPRSAPAAKPPIAADTAPQSEPLSSASVTNPIPPKSKKLIPPKPKPHVDSVRIGFDAATGIVARADKTVSLTRRTAQLFRLVAKGTDQQPLDGIALRELMGLGDTTKVASYVSALRSKLLPIGLLVRARPGRSRSGYWLEDASTGRPVTVVPS